LWQAKPLLSSNNIKELVDPILHGAYDEEQMKLVILTASMCIDQASILRPQMSEACPFIYKIF
jgi:hypothetical protein